MISTNVGPCTCSSELFILHRVTSRRQHFDLDLTAADFRTSVDVKHNDNGYSTRMARVNLTHNAGAASQNSSRKRLKALTDVRGHSPIFANSRSFSRAVGGAASSELIEDQIDQTIRLKTPRAQL